MVCQTYPVLASPVVVCSPPSCGVSKGPDRPREDGQQRQVQPWTAPSGAVAGPIVALAIVGRTQHRWQEGSLVTAPATQRTIIGGRPDCAVTNRDGAGQVRRLISSRRWRAPAVSRRRKVGAGRSGSHGRRHRSPCSEPPHTPYGARGRDSLCLSHATGSNLSLSQFISGRPGRIFPAEETAPSYSTDSWSF